MIPSHRPPTHPGEILLEEFLKPKKMTQVELAAKMGIPLNRLNELIRGKRGMTADTAGQRLTPPWQFAKQLHLSSSA